MGSTPAGRPPAKGVRTTKNVLNRTGGGPRYLDGFISREEHVDTDLNGESSDDEGRLPSINQSKIVTNS